MSLVNFDNVDLSPSALADAARKAREDREKKERDEAMANLKDVSIQIGVYAALIAFVYLMSKLGF